MKLWFSSPKCLRDLNVSPGVVVYSSLISGLYNSGRLDGAKRIFDDMVCRGISATYNSMIHGRLQDAVKLFNSMVDRGLEPDVISCTRSAITYGTMLDGLCKNRKVDEAIELVKSMEGNGILANIHICTIPIGCSFQAGELEYAKKLFNQIPKKGLAPNVVTYTAVIDGLFLNNMLLEANLLIIEMEENGCLRDARAYDTIINGFLVANETTKALYFLHKMRERNFAPSDSVICLLVHTLSGQCRERNQKLSKP
ncbi:hypothetical protein C5167_004230 [Papaver somniferum]|nr:hypothetical protein C5167_004230 [Papaver somniferum]